MILPELIVVGHKDIQIEDHGSYRVRANLGEWMANEQKILICTDMNEQKTLEILVHEIIHAILDIHGIKIANEEDFLERFISPLLALFRFNPELRDLLFPPQS